MAGGFDFWPERISKSMNLDVSAIFRLFVIETKIGFLHTPGCKSRFNPIPSQRRLLTLCN